MRLYFLLMENHVPFVWLILEEYANGCTFHCRTHIMPNYPENIWKGKLEFWLLCSISSPQQAGSNIGTPVLPCCSMAVLVNGPFPPRSCSFPCATCYRAWGIWQSFARACTWLEFQLSREEWHIIPSKQKPFHGKMNVNTKGGWEIKVALRGHWVSLGTLISPLMLWFGSALEFIPVKYVPNETSDLLGELHQFSSQLFQLLLEFPLKYEAHWSHFLLAGSGTAPAPKP